MRKQGKFWGTRFPICEHDTWAVDRIYILAGGFCSKHCHQSKYNMFFCESGEVEILEWKDGNKDPDRTVLRRGDSCSVPPGNYHMFKAIADSVVYELYWVELGADIKRKTIGGMACG